MGLRDFIRSFRDSSPAAVKRRMAEVRERLQAMSVDEARAGVEAVLTRPDHFRVTRVPLADTGVALLLSLPNETQRLFREIASVEAGGFAVSRESIGPLARDQRFIKIGVDLEHADVLVDRDDHIITSEDDGRPVPDSEERSRSIWHHLLEVEALTWPADSRLGSGLTSA